MGGSKAIQDNRIKFFRLNLGNPYVEAKFSLSREKFSMGGVFFSLVVCIVAP